MKRISTLLGLAAFLPMLAHAASLDLTITNVEADSGEVKVAVFDSEAGWKASDAVAGYSTDAETGSVTLTLDGLAPGEIGIKLYHDVDDNGDLNRGRMGIPSEPYGFSNDAPIRFGPPKWSDAKFVLGEGGNSHTIALR